MSGEDENGPKSVASLNDQIPSTSARNKEWSKWAKDLVDSDQLNQIRQKFKGIRQSYSELLETLRENQDAIIQSERIKKRLTRWHDGWQRVINIYPWETADSGDGDDQKPALVASPEWQLLSMTFMTAATIGFVYGGLRTTPESIRRFDLYAQGKNFGAVAYHDRRKRDFVFARFWRQGFTKGLYMGTLTSSIILFTVGLTAYRDRYCLWYFPLASAAMHSAMTFFQGTGIYGLSLALIISAIPSFFLTGATLTGCYFAGTTVDEGYKMLRDNYKQYAEKKAEEDSELLRYMASRHFAFKPYARRWMREEKQNGTWRGARPTENGEYSQELLKFAEQSDELSSTSTD